MSIKISKSCDRHDAVNAYHHTDGTWTLHLVRDEVGAYWLRQAAQELTAANIPVANKAKMHLLKLGGGFRAYDTLPVYAKFFQNIADAGGQRVDIQVPDDSAASQYFAKPLYSKPFEATTTMITDDEEFAMLVASDEIWGSIATHVDQLCEGILFPELTVPQPHVVSSQIIPLIEQMTKTRR